MWGALQRACGRYPRSPAAAPQQHSSAACCLHIRLPMQLVPPDHKAAAPQVLPLQLGSAPLQPDVIRQHGFSAEGTDLPRSARQGTWPSVASLTQGRRQVEVAEGAAVQQPCRGALRQAGAGQPPPQPVVRLHRRPRVVARRLPALRRCVNADVLEHAAGSEGEKQLGCRVSNLPIAQVNGVIIHTMYPPPFGCTSTTQLTLRLHLAVPS